MRVIRWLAGHLYMQQSTNVDQLPYTDQIKDITRRYNKYTGQDATERDIYLSIQGLRKGGGLPKRGKAS